MRVIFLRHTCINEMECENETGAKGEIAQFVVGSVERRRRQLAMLLMLPPRCSRILFRLLRQQRLEALLLLLQQLLLYGCVLICLLLPLSIFFLNILLLLFKSVVRSHTHCRFQKHCFVALIGFQHALVAELVLLPALHDVVNALQGGVDGVNK